MNVPSVFAYKLYTTLRHGKIFQALFHFKEYLVKSMNAGMKAAHFLNGQNSVAEGKWRTVGRGIHHLVVFIQGDLPDSVWLHWP